MSGLLAYRSQFNSLNNCHHLISNSLGAMPNQTAEMLSQFARMWADRSVRAWEEKWWMLAREVGDKIGRLINAPSNSVTMQPNVTSAEAVILSCFDFQAKRNKVVMVDAEFPSLLYLYKSWLGPAGRLEIVECGAGPILPLEKLLDAIDEKTLLVSISSVFFRSSYLIDAAAVIEKAHQVGAKVVLDIYQAFGVVPLDVKKLEVDFAAGGCLKWICGGPAACFLYVRPDLSSKLKPRITGWLAHVEPFAFEAQQMNYTDGAYRFLNGTPSVLSFYVCQPGLDIVSEIGVERIRKRSLEMTTRMIDNAAGKDWSVFVPQEEELRGGTVALNIPHAQRISKILLERDFLIDYRPGVGIRVSPHFYNTDQEIDDIFDEIEKIKAEENW
ncbi:MAG: aminotransferase class V-fold PLP-dependent enzyme [candidate division Zixibacteria bacterium]